MPSVGMRRTTRVFGVVKAADGARVLRSGRRLWPNTGEPKVKRAHDVDKQVWDSLLKDHGKSKGNKTSGSSRIGNKPCIPKVNSGEKAEKEDDLRVKRQRKTKTVDAQDEKPVDKMFGIVYSRKRKRLCPQTSGSPDKSDETLRRLKFYCRRRRVSERVSGSRALLTLVVDWSCRDCWFSSVFGLVIRYLRSEKLRLSALITFFMSQPINNVYADHGIKFFLDPPDSPNGICKFFGAVDSLPLFSIDFAAAPPCFMDMNITLFLRMIRPSFIFVKKYLFLLENGENQPVEESDTDVEEVIARACNSRDESVLLGLHPSTRASKLSGGNAQYRGGLGSHSFQKRRSSFRRRRARNLSHGPHKSYNGVSFSDLTGSRKNGITFSSTVSPRKLRSSMMNKSALQSSEVSSPKVRTKQELNSLCCSANILVIDQDRCMREGGFEVMLELSPSKEWHVVIKKDGTITYTQKAQKMMRPCSSNRFTHSIIWAGDDNWKLEFCDRQDWLAFKDIYKECYERNVLEPNVKVIPIPGVREVPGFLADTENHCSFSRPVSYISVKEDEVSRALARSSATYDLDSEDEEWLKNHNRQLLGGEDSQQLQLDTFEMMIDGFEKACFRIPCDDLLDEKATTAGLSCLGKQEVLEAVYSYWARKRKQRKAPLLRVFQGQQVKKTPLLSKPVFRKRRSFKRQGSQLHAKAKQLNPLQVKVPEQDNSEEENALARAEEAKALAETTMEIAITKRQRAQAHAENADLAVYKAMMALRIAEAIRVAESSEVAEVLLVDV